MPHVRITRAIAAAIASTLIVSTYISLDSASASAVVTLRVCPSGCAFSQLAPAIAAAKSGDTVEVAAGTYKGGLAIDVSVKLVGAGAHTTIIRGGGPVVTIGASGGVSEPTVSITGVTITGGVTRSSPQSEPMTGMVGVIAAGGGVEIAPRATVAISNSAIVDNRVAPLRAVAQGPPCPGGVRCPYAQAQGGGIDDSGKLTLTDTTISGNRVGAAAGLSNVASDADGGAINLNEGALTVINSTISDNTASATAPNGRYADAGAIDAAIGTVTTIRNSSLTDNSATLAASEPNSVAANGGAGAGSGAIHVQSNASATISDTKISGNSARMTNTLGDAEADSGGVHADVDLKLTGDVFADNRVYAATLAGSSGDAEGDSGAGELSGTISNTRFTGNTVTVKAANGSASGSSGATLFGPGSISNSVVQANHLHVASPGGTASAVGGGIETGSSFTPGEAAPQTLTNTPVSENTAEATGRSGTARGGIFDEKVPNGPPGGPLTLINTNVTHNTLSGSAGITLQGGGVFATFKLTLTDSAVTANTPDECAGTAC